MKKNTRSKKPSVSSVVLGVTTVASLALSLHLNSLVDDYKQSHDKLNAKYKEVLLENEELRDTNVHLKDETKKSSRLLGQSRLEIEKLNKETDNLQAEVKQQKDQINSYKKKVSDLKKQNEQHRVASRGEFNGEWTYFRLTYYDNEQQSTGKNPGDKGYGITASGRPTQVGVSIAVDPNIIPLGTWVLIKWPDGRTEKRRADDTGSAINGYDIDYYVPVATLDMGDPIVGVKILGKE